MGGRKEHTEYERLLFIKRKSEKGENVAFCTVCKRDIGNTAVKRLESHRRVCKLNSHTHKNVNVDMDNINNNEVDSSITSDCSSTSCNNQSKNFNKQVNVNKCKASSSLIIDSSSSMNTSIAPTLNLISKSNCINEVHSRKQLPIKQKNKLKAFLDDLNEEELERIHEALVEFFIECQIQFDSIHSKYFKNLFNLLRPAYQLPTFDKLKNLLHLVYHKHINETNVFSSTGILLIRAQENNEVTSMTFNLDGKFLFIKSARINSIDDMQLFVRDSVYKMEQKCKVNVYTVISDFKTNVRMPFEVANTDSTYWYFKCMSLRLNSFLRETIGYDFVEEVKSLMAIFNSPELQDGLVKLNGNRLFITESVDRCALLKMFKSCLENLKAMRRLVADNELEIANSYVSRLYDEFFKRNLEENTTIIEYVNNKFIKQQLNYSRVDELEDWFALLDSVNNPNIKIIIKKQIKSLSDAVTLTANLLHPKYLGNKIKNDEENMQTMVQFLVSRLPESGVDSSLKYCDQTDIFKTLSEKEIESPTVYWRLCLTNSSFCK